MDCPQWKDVWKESSQNWNQFCLLTSFGSAAVPTSSTPSFKVRLICMWKKSFQNTLHILISYSYLQTNLIAKMRSVCPTISTTRRTSSRFVCYWHIKYRHKAMAYLDVKNPSFVQTRTGMSSGIWSANFWFRWANYLTDKKFSNSSQKSEQDFEEACTRYREYTLNKVAVLWCGQYQTRDGEQSLLSSNFCSREPVWTVEFFRGSRVVCGSADKQTGQSLAR